MWGKSRSSCHPIDDGSRRARLSITRLRSPLPHDEAQFALTKHSRCADCGVVLLYDMMIISCMTVCFSMRRHGGVDYCELLLGAVGGAHVIHAQKQSPAVLRSCGFSRFVPAWSYGGENDEVIRFMQGFNELQASTNEARAY